MGSKTGSITGSIKGSIAVTMTGSITGGITGSINAIYIEYNIWKKTFKTIQINCYVSRDILYFWSKSNIEESLMWNINIRH